MSYILIHANSLNKSKSMTKKKKKQPSLYFVNTVYKEKPNIHIKINLFFIFRESIFK